MTAANKSAQIITEFDRCLRKKLKKVSLGPKLRIRRAGQPYSGQVTLVQNIHISYPPSSLRSSVLEVADRILLALLSPGLLPLDIRPHGIHTIDASQPQPSLISLPYLEESMFSIFLILELLRRTRRDKAEEQPTPEIAPRTGGIDLLYLPNRGATPMDKAGQG